MKKNLILVFISIFISVFISIPVSSCSDTSYEITEGSDYYEISSENETKEENTLSEKEPEIHVYVGGEVLNPGVYVLPAESYVYVLLNQAGGSLINLDETDINPVARLNDGDRIIVSASKQEDDTKTISDGLININEASLEQLKTLPGIGDVRGNAIINYRNANGKFTSIEDVKKVESIKDGIYEGIKDLIKVR